MRIAVVRGAQEHGMNFLDFNRVAERLPARASVMGGSKASAGAAAEDAPFIPDIQRPQPP
jgi:hypothetical protein